MSSRWSLSIICSAKRWERRGLMDGVDDVDGYLYAAAIRMEEKLTM